MHPFVSFLTEELYAHLPEAYRGSELLIAAPYPQPFSATGSASSVEPAQLRYGATPKQLEQFAQLQELVIGVRTLRSEFCIPPGQRIAIAYRAETGREAGDFARFLAQERAWVESLCKAEWLKANQPTGKAIGKTLQNGELLLFIREWIDVEKERQRLLKLLAREEKLLRSLEARLANPKFLERAPAHLVEQEKAKQGELAASITKNRGFMAQLAEL